MGEFSYYGNKDSSIAIIGWGSTSGPIMETIERLKNEGYNVKGLVPEMLYPINYKAFEDFLENVEYLFIPEISFSAQFYKLLKVNFDLPKNTVRIKRSGGVPFYIEEIYSKIKEVIK
jgi:2-oxoglutarate ferredoxin oxidoreductase subunit alpha